MMGKISQENKARKCAGKALSALLLLGVVGLMTATVVLSLFVSPPALNVFPLHQNKTRHQIIVDKVNSGDFGWTAVLNEDASDPMTKDAFLHYVAEQEKENIRLKALTDHPSIQEIQQAVEKMSQEQISTLDSTNIEIPTHFDAREAWPFCDSIGRIENQGGCGSCWAVGSAMAMSDRHCIHSNATLRPQLSIQDLLTCCTYCGNAHGCRGGDSILAYYYWMTSGIVSGGSYGSKEGCRPYEVSAACGSPCPIAYYTISDTPACSPSCSTPYWDYKASKFFGSRMYMLVPRVAGEGFDMGDMRWTDQRDVRMEGLVQKELLLNGPLTVSFAVYEDLQHYQSGVYKYVAGELLYGHWARLIGWGEDEEGRPFWTIANSWGRDFGEYGIVRVDRHMRLFDQIAGFPRYELSPTHPTYNPVSL